MIHSTKPVGSKKSNVGGVVNKQLNGSVIDEIHRYMETRAADAALVFLINTDENLVTLDAVQLSTDAGWHRVREASQRKWCVLGFVTLGREGCRVICAPFTDQPAAQKLFKEVSDRVLNDGIDALEVRYL
jgi:hypothetical protein